MNEIDALLNRKDMTFEEAVDYFKERVPVKASEFYKIAEGYRNLAFTVSGYSKTQILKRFYDEILAALEEGNTLTEFRANMNEFLESQGYEGLDPLQADNIFRTNIQTAYNVGHYEQMSDPDVVKLRPYWQYDAVNDIHTRPSHLAMDGLSLIHILHHPGPGERQSECAPRSADHERPCRRRPYHLPGYLKAP